MMENCLDAGATNIRIVVKGGGIKMLQIQDNGCGIKKEDLPIVCERWTTSKLEKFEDLKKITTFGFRGEALASISHIAHVQIVTMTADSTCAYRAYYQDGKMVGKNGESADPKPCAGVKGTQITVEDMFYNVTSRQKALKQPNDEYLKIVDVVTKYALHNYTASFNLKKMGENTSDVHTQRCSSVKESIKQLFGQKVANDIFEINHKDDKLKFNVDVYITSPNYRSKKSSFILFINNRLVDSPTLKRTIEQVYSLYLPKGHHPFMYISLHLDPRTVDVNVHPTKSEVRFLHEDEIIDKIREQVVQKLDSTNATRTFSTQQTLVPNVMADDVIESSNNTNINNTSSKPVYQNKMVRTDARSQTLHSFMSPANSNNTNQYSKLPLASASMDVDEDFDTTNKKHVNKRPREDDELSGDLTTNNENNREDNDQAMAKPKLKKRKRPQLTSVLNLLSEVKEAGHAGLQQIFKNYTFVGAVDDRSVLLQYKTKLYLCNMCVLSKELMYQSVLQNFACMSTIKLSNPAPVHDLVMLALDHPLSGYDPNDGDQETIATYIVELLRTRASMLKEYFNIQIDDDGNLVGLPLLIDNYVPDIDALATFILRLGTEVEWKDEQECFETLSRELAEFYALHPLPAEEVAQRTKELETREWTAEHVILPALRSVMVPPRAFANDGTVIQVAALEKLYKVFERC
jgi:DNA mismatch repair protein MLH1